LQEKAKKISNIKVCVKISFKAQNEISLSIFHFSSFPIISNAIDNPIFLLHLKYLTLK
jgi:hypothetical protein